jgi:two-component system response regulator HydG
VSAAQSCARPPCAWSRRPTAACGIGWPTGAFRQDLFYRLSTFPIPIPPLRERRADLPELIDALMQRVVRQRQQVIAPAALAVLQAYDYPGNVRELRNVLERASLMCDGEIIGVEHLPP